MSIQNYERYISGESVCHCFEEYRGVNCRHHYTSIPARDSSCQGLLGCHHLCHLQILNLEEVPLCSCRAGYRLVDRTQCVPQDEWDVAVVIEVAQDENGGSGTDDSERSAARSYEYTEEEAVNNTLDVLAEYGAAAYNRNLSVSSRSGRVEALVKVSGAALARRLANTTTWHQHFPTATHVTAAVAPQLSIGPVGAEWHVGYLLLRCPVYGGPHLRFIWYKDGNLVLDHSVTNCSYESRTPRLHILTQRGATENSCEEVVRVEEARQQDGGIFQCHVQDRSYRASREVVVGMNESLELVLQPSVVTVHRGENVTLSCTTKNRLWAELEHYQARWSQEPAHAFAGLTHAILPRRGYSITFHGVSETMKVTCMMREKEGLVWDADRDLEGVEEASVEGEVHVVTPATLTCLQEQRYGILWPLTAVGVIAHEQCPSGYTGEGATRACHAQAPPTAATWRTPDFSACVRPALTYLMTPLLLYARGYNALAGNTADVARTLLGILKEGEPNKTLLPGEGATVLRILDLLEAARRRKEQEEGKGKRQFQIPLSVFLKVIQVLVEQRGVISGQDVGEMLRLTRGGLRAVVQGKEVRLADLVARVASVSSVSLSPATKIEYPAFLKVEKPVEKGGKEDAGSGERPVVMAVSVKVEVKTAPPIPSIEEGGRSRRSTREEHLKGEEEEEEKEEEEEIVRIGVLMYLHPDIFLPQPREKAVLGTSYLVDWQVASPWVEVLVVEKNAGNSTHSTFMPFTTTTTTTATTTANTTNALSVTSHLWFSCSFPPSREPVDEKDRLDKEETEWNVTCARLQVDPTGVLQVDYNSCSSAVEGSAEGLKCTCEGEGLFGLLQVSTTPVRVIQEEDQEETKEGEHDKVDKMKDDEDETEKAGEDNKKKRDEDKEEEEEEEEEKEEDDEYLSFVVVVLCLLSAVVALVCLVLLFPGASHPLVQLRLLKCVAIAALNLALAAITFWPYSTFVREGVVVMGGASVVLCMGVGVSQQLALHQHLAVTTQTTPLTTITTQATTLFLAGVSLLVGLAAWGALPRHTHPMSPSSSSWLLVGGNWAAVAVVGGGAGVVTWVWVLVTVHNLRKLSFIREKTPQHRSVSMVRRRVAQLTALLAMEWMVLASSLFLHHQVGRYLFCAASLMQSAVSLVLYWGGSGAPCWCLPHHPLFSTPGPAASHNEGVGGEEGGCMSGLMACRLPSSKTGKRDDATKDYNSEFRGRGGSLWSQTTSTVVPLDPADLLPASTDPILQARRDLPLYARCGSNAPAGARRPRNLFLRGTNFLCGERVTSPQDHSSAGTPLDADLRAAGRPRELSFSLHQAVIHEASPAARGSRSRHSKDKYLDMSVQESAWLSPSSGPAREYVNLEPRVSVQVSDAQSLSDKEEEGSGYLPMGGEWKGKEEEGGTSTPAISVGLAGCEVKAKGPTEGATQVTPSPPGISSQPVVAPDDDVPLYDSSSHLETSGDAAGSTTQSPHDGSRRARREETDDADTPPCCPETPPRGKNREPPE
ncbi:uncharacterized protein LOC135093192 [Scylla paramamosain]|uniref:uncharacterized protein LOC135093192 n=1 Tax=Scylla paramamosain TaxID=85552 RepID=UPI0030833DE0